MGEAEWLTCDDPRRMLGFLNVRRTSPRKLRLFVCACRRQGRIHRAGEENRLRIVELAERYSDGELLAGELLVSGDPAVLASAEVAEEVNSDCRARLIRDIFVNPFRPLPPLGRRAASLWERELDSALRWNGGVIPDLARAAYEERILPAGTLHPARLAVLADALEEAGCTNADILGHLRGPENHVRGCWVVDVLLKKE